MGGQGQSSHAKQRRATRGLILAADCVYDPELNGSLVRVLSELLSGSAPPSASCDLNDKSIEASRDHAEDTLPTGGFGEEENEKGVSRVEEQNLDESLHETPSKLQALGVPVRVPPYRAFPSECSSSGVCVQQVRLMPSSSSIDTVSVNTQESGQPQLEEETEGIQRLEALVASAVRNPQTLADFVRKAEAAGLCVREERREGAPLFLLGERERSLVASVVILRLSSRS